MYLPKTDVYESLKKLNYYVSQVQPPIFTDLPAIIFRVGNNVPEYDLDNNILNQDLEIQIDIWADDSVTASNVLTQVEEIMRSNYYKLSHSSDVPNISNLYHIVNRFTKLN